jgi:cytochrome o ubiquinol oxidase operon protein cyoD
MSEHITARTYIAGYILSIILTLTAFKVVDDDLLMGWGFTLTLVAFAVVQLFVQLLFFLHLDKERKPRHNLMAFAFMAMVLLIIVLGSLWIMDNLNYHVMTEEEIIQDEGLDY